MNCPLCLNSQNKIFAKTESTLKKKDQKRTEEFFECSNCDLIYKADKYLLENTEEKLRYQNHNNDENDPGYRQFLLKAITPLSQYLNPGDQGLDFGCGPGPTTSKIMTQMGYHVTDYDPYFMPVENLNKNQYDFIISTEVFEHLNSPKKELDLIKSLLKPHAYLCLMTQLYSEDINFKSWWYKNDPTHIVFYKQQTMQWIEKTYEMNIIHLNNNVIIFKNES